jgi:hypothetical protein
MSNQSVPLGKHVAYSSRPWLAPHRLVLAALWLVTTITLVATLVVGVRDTVQYRAVRIVLHVAYAVALLWYLGRTGPPLEHLPDLEPLLLRRWEIGRWIPVLGIALMLVLVAFSDAGEGILTLLMIVATGPILVVLRREIRIRPAILGLALAGIAILAGLPFWRNGFVSNSAFFGLPALVPPMFLAGGMLSLRTGLGGSQVYAGRYGKALKSYLWGCLLFVPLGLFNAAGGSMVRGVTWLNRWWMPLSLSWFSGITEEAWFRLYLVSLCYLLLRPVFSKYPALAVVCAVLFSAITFGLGHGRTLDHFLTTGLLYGLPMAVVFARRDWEHAVGAHYMINMIPSLMVFLET